MLKESVGDRNPQREKRAAETQRTDVKEAREQTGRKKKGAHQELSVRGRRSEREQRKEGL